MNQRKTTYSKPRLRQYGSVSVLTRGADISTQNDPNGKTTTGGKSML